MHSQIDALTAAGAERIFTDKVTGKNATRPGLAACIDHLPASAVLVVHSTDRLGRLMTDPDEDENRDVAAPRVARGGSSSPYKSRTVT